MCVCVCVCVCVSVKSSLTPGASVRPENTVMNSAGNISLKLLCSRVIALPALYGYCVVGHFLTVEERYLFRHLLSVGQVSAVTLVSAD